MVDDQHLGDTKTCPACAEDIKFDAGVCRYCGQEFNVSRAGYCSTCHRRVQVDITRNCPACGSAVIDVVATSDPIDAPAAQAAPYVVTVPPPLYAPRPPPQGTASPTRPTTPPPPPPWSAASAGMPGTQPKKPSRLRLLLSVIALVVISLVVIGSWVGEFGARSPQPLADKLGQAQISCTKLETVHDTDNQRAIACASTDSQLVLIVTFAHRPSTSDWVGDYCALRYEAPANAGAVVSGSDFHVMVVQVDYPKGRSAPPKPRVVADRLAAVLGGTVTTFDCDTRSGL